MGEYGKRKSSNVVENFKNPTEQKMI
jgi:hypothetical protein